MDYFKGLLRNLAILFGLGLIMYIAAPGIIGLVYQTMGGLYGLLLIPMLIVAALPDRKKKKSYTNVNRRTDNIAGGSTHKMADKRYRDLLIYGFIIIGLFALLLAMVNNSKTLGIGGTGLLVILLLMKFLPNTFLKRLDKKGKEVTRARKGANAEERVDDLFAGLTDQYFIINDVVSKFGNIDHVIIKKNAGIFLIETKSHHGKVNVQAKTLFLNGHLPEKDFISQTLNNAYWLRGRIKLIFEYNVWIYPIIVFTNAFVPFAPPIKGIHIVNIKFLISTLEKTNNNNTLNEQLWNKRESIFKLLKEM
jgi:hypothetical protein